MSDFLVTVNQCNLPFNILLDQYPSVVKKTSIIFYSSNENLVLRTRSELFGYARNQ